MRAMWACAAVLVLLAPGTARTEESTRRYADAETKAGAAFPADWQVTVHKATAVAKRILWLEVRPPGAAASCIVSVYHLHGLGEPLAQAHFELVAVAKREKATQSWLKERPRPHALFELEEKGAKRRLVHIYRHIRGNGCTFAVECPAPMWDEVADTMFAAVDSLQIAAPEWPARISGYEPVELDGYTYLLHPAAHRKDVRAYHRHLRLRERAFQEQFGPFEVSPANPATVVFHRVPEDAKPISETAARARGGHHQVMGGRRIYAVPLKPGEGAFSHCDNELFWLFYWLRFGCSSPRWLLDGTGTFLWAADGKKLPVGNAWIVNQPSPPARFADLPALEGKNWDLYRKTAALYVALFREGPKKYRKAYAAYLAARRKRPGWRAAEMEHLQSLDQEALRQAAGRFLGDVLKKPKDPGGN